MTIEIRNIIKPHEKDHLAPDLAHLALLTNYFGGNFYAAGFTGGRALMRRFCN